MRSRPVHTDDHRGGARVVSSGGVVVVAVAALCIGAVGSSGRLLEMAERLEFGPDRDRWVGAARQLDDAAHRVRIDAPADALRELRGGTGVESDPVLGDLTLVEPAPDITTTATTSVTTPTVDSTAPSIAAPQTTTSATETTETTETSAPTTSSPPPTTEAPPTTDPTPTTMRSASPDAPLQVWIGGDSLGEYVGSAFVTDLADDDVEVVLDFHIATGLTRPDFFDWPAQLTKVMRDPAERPEAVVFMVGGNDDQPMRTTTGERLLTGSEAWIAEYARRSALLMDIAAYDGVHVYWLLLPPMADDQRDDVADKINRAVTGEAGRRSWVSTVDLDPLLAGDDGGYAPRRPDPVTGDERAARQDDGIHITRRASRWVAADVIDLIEARWGLPER